MTALHQPNRFEDQARVALVAAAGSAPDRVPRSTPRCPMNLICSTTPCRRREPTGEPVGFRQGVCSGRASPTGGSRPWRRTMPTAASGATPTGSSPSTTPRHEGTSLRSSRRDGLPRRLRRHPRCQGHTGRGHVRAACRGPAWRRRAGAAARSRADDAAGLVAGPAHRGQTAVPHRRPRKGTRPGRGERRVRAVPGPHRHAAPKPPPPSPSPSSTRSSPRSSTRRRSTRPSLATRPPTHPDLRSDHESRRRRCRTATSAGCATCTARRRRPTAGTATDIRTSTGTTAATRRCSATTGST